MADTKDKIKAELQALVDEQKELFTLLHDEKRFFEFGRVYQLWYSKSLKIVQTLAPDRLEEFIGYYRINPKRKGFTVGTYTIQDYVMGMSPPEYSLGELAFDHIASTSMLLANQFQILASLTSRIDSVLSDVEGHLFADLQDGELNAAKKLMDISLRASGALAGVVLERHLQQMIKNHAILLKKKDPTISDMNDPLKGANVFDMATWRKIQYLADIRNMCSHQKSEEPTKDQVNDMIQGVDYIIKNFF